MTDIRNPLLAWRKRLGLNQTEAAAKLGMTLRGYGDLERGDRHAAGVPLMHRLAAAAVESGLEPIGGAPTPPPAAPAAS